MWSNHWYNSQPNSLPILKKKVFIVWKHMREDLWTAETSWEMVEWGTDRRNWCYANEQLKNWARNYIWGRSSSWGDQWPSFFQTTQKALCDLIWHLSAQTWQAQLQEIEDNRNCWESVREKPRHADIQNEGQCRWGQCWLVTNQITSGGFLAEQKTISQAEKKII